jgi:hypothetical protein
VKWIRSRGSKFWTGFGVLRRLVRLHPLLAFAVARAAQKLYDIPVKAWLAKFGRR